MMRMVQEITLIVIALSVLFVGGCDDRVYRSAEFGFEIEVPGGFERYDAEVSPAPGNAKVAAVFISESESESDFRENIWIEVSQAKDELTAGQYRNSFIDWVEKNDSGFVLLDSGEFDTDDQLTISWASIAKAELGGEGIQMLFFAVADRTIYSIGCTTIDMAEYREWRKVFLRVARSFAIASRRGSR